MELKVRKVGPVEEMSPQEREAHIIKSAEKKEEPTSQPEEVKEEPQKEEPENIEQEPETPDVQQEPEQPSLKEEDVLSFIKNKYDREINSVEDLFQQKQESQEIPEDISAYLEYRQKTGRGFDDYMKLSQDYSSMDDDKVLKEYILSTEKGFDEQDALDEIRDRFSYDEDDDLSDKEIRKIEREKKKAVKQAREYFEDQKKMYKEPLESRTSQGISDEDKKKLEAYSEYTKQQQTLQEQQESRRKWFEQKTNELFSSDFKGFDFDLGDNRKLTYKPGDAEQIKSAQLDTSSFMKKFVDDNGLIKDAAGFHKALAVARDPEGFAKFFYEQGKTDAVESDARKIKNIDMRSNTPQVSKKDGIQIRAISRDTGTGLKIKSRSKT